MEVAMKHDPLSEFWDIFRSLIQKGFRVDADPRNGAMTVIDGPFKSGRPNQGADKNRVPTPNTQQRLFA